MSNRTAVDATASVAGAAAAAAADSAGTLFYGEEIPCTAVRAQQVWASAFGRLNSESPVRQADVSGDGVADVVFGFGLDDDGGPGYDGDATAVPRCGEQLCEGGVMALDGRTGVELWRRWTAFNVFSLVCTESLGGDATLDCVAAGRGGVSDSVGCGWFGNLFAMDAVVHLNLDWIAGWHDRGEGRLS